MIQTITAAALPAQFQHIAGMPQQLFCRSKNEDAMALAMQRPRVAVVGSRKVTAYGQSITQQLVTELAARGVVIVSGLAFGVDAIAHRTALEAGGLTIAVLPGGVDQIYPRTHTRLARDILDNDGVLVSEYPLGMPALIKNFVERNRIVAGLSDALLITEAAEKSGSLHTARFAMEQGIPVLVTPGNINSPTSVGTNNLLKQGVVPITSIQDVLFELEITSASDQAPITMRVRGSNADEQKIIDLLEQGISEGGEILSASGLSVEKFNHNLTMLEITAKVRALGANHWALS